MLRYLLFSLAVVAAFAAAGCASDRGGSGSWDAPSYTSSASGGGGCSSCR